MLAKALRYKTSEEVRESLTIDSLKRIKKSYEDLYNNITRQINASGKNMQKQRLVLLQRELEDSIKQLNDDIANNITNTMKTVSKQVTYETRSYLKQMGFSDADINNAYFYVPDQIVNNIITGNVYKAKWTLNDAIWGYNKNTHNTINNIIAMGTKENKSTYEIAKDLEKYVNPEARKPSRVIRGWRIDENGKKVKDKFYFGKVDYNAQRLARTLISHSYQQSIIRESKNDPFVKGIKWLTSNFHSRVCIICTERSQQNNYGLGTGVYPKDRLPLDHPNGMCTFVTVMDDSMEDIADMVGKWYQSPVGTFPDIDKFAMDFAGLIQ